MTASSGCSSRRRQTWRVARAAACGRPGTAEAWSRSGTCRPAAAGAPGVAQAPVDLPRPRLCDEDLHRASEPVEGSLNARAARPRSAAGRRRRPHASPRWPAASGSAGRRRMAGRPCATGDPSSKTPGASTGCGRSASTSTRCSLPERAPHLLRHQLVDLETAGSWTSCQDRSADRYRAGWISAPATGVATSRPSPSTPTPATERLSSSLPKALSPSTTSTRSSSPTPASTTSVAGSSGDRSVTAATRTTRSMAPAV